METKPNPSSTIWERKAGASSIPKKEQSIPYVEYVLRLRRNRQKRSKNRFEITSNPSHFIKETHSGGRHGPEQWQYDHWKARDATKGLTKRGYDSIVHRWLTDPQFQESQMSHGWTEEYCRYLDYLTTFNIKYNATGPERSRYHNMLALRFKKMERILERCQIETIF